MSTPAFSARLASTISERETSMAESGMAGIPGIGAMTDTLEFVKNLWGGMKIPGMAMPSLSVDDINKQIADLKAVEAWLNVNMNMLRSTIQALEVQSATLAALQSMSASMASMVQPAEQPKPNGQAQQAAGTPPTPAAPPAPSFNFSPPTADKPLPPGGGEGSASASTPPQPETIGMNSAATFANPAAWWNLLQDQFRQAVTSAVAPEAKAGEKGASAAAEAPSPKPRAKPKTETAAKTAAKTAAAPRKRKS
jgi:hypothetical protein